MAKPGKKDRFQANNATGTGGKPGRRWKIQKGSKTGSTERINETYNILNNVVTGSFIPGISLHAFGPGVISSTKLIGNVLSDNGAGQVSGVTTGIEIAAGPSPSPVVSGTGTITGTQVLSNTTSNDYFNIYDGGTGTHVANMTE